MGPKPTPQSIHIPKDPNPENITKRFHQTKLNPFILIHNLLLQIKKSKEGALFKIGESLKKYPKLRINTTTSFDNIV